MFLLGFVVFPDSHLRGGKNGPFGHADPIPGHTLRRDVMWDVLCAGIGCAGGSNESFIVRQLYKVDAP